MSYKIAVEITGIAPLTEHRLTEEDIAKIDKSSTGGRKTPAKKANEALDRMYFTSDGFIGMPKRNIKSCLLEGVKKANLKFGRGSLYPYVKATVFVLEDIPSFGIKLPDFIEKFPVQRKDGQQVVVTRGGINPGWKLSFTLLIVDDRRDQEQLHSALEEAGILVGIGSGRPEYGRFEVSNWKVIK